MDLLSRLCLHLEAFVTLDVEKQLNIKISVERRIFTRQKTEFIKRFIKNTPLI